MVEFEEILYFQGFEGILGVRMVIFDGVKSGEMLDFSVFARSVYRSDLSFDSSFLGQSMYVEQIPWFSLPNTCFEM